jgi:hypothetical protein
MSGPDFLQGQTHFFLAKTREKAAFVALKKASKKHFLGDEAEFGTTLDEILDGAGGIRTHRDENGNIDGILFGDRCYSAIEVLDALAPFVRAGSTVVLSAMGSDPGVPTRHSFDGSQREEEELEAGEDDDWEKLLETPSFEALEAAKPAPTWEAARASMPARPSPYAISSVYAVGDWVEHKTLGPGLVIGLVEQTKVRILFEKGTRVLLHRG